MVSSDTAKHVYENDAIWACVTIDVLTAGRSVGLKLAKSVRRTLSKRERKRKKNCHIIQAQRFWMKSPISR